MSAVGGRPPKGGSLQIAASSSLRARQGLDFDPRQSSSLRQYVLPHIALGTGAPLASTLVELRRVVHEHCGGDSSSARNDVVRRSSTGPHRKLEILVSASFRLRVSAEPRRYDGTSAPRSSPLRPRLRSCAAHRNRLPWISPPFASQAGLREWSMRREDNTCE